jgi:hypothetical protein
MRVVLARPIEIVAKRNLAAPAGIDALDFIDILDQHSGSRNRISRQGLAFSALI